MALTLGPILVDGGIDPVDAITIRHAYTTEPGGIHADSTDDEILAYTAEQSTSTQKFLAVVQPLQRVRGPDLQCRRGPAARARTLWAAGPGADG